MFPVRVGIKRKFAEDLVVGNKAAAILFLCMEDQCKGTRVPMHAHRIGVRQQQLSLQLFHLPLDLPSVSLTPGQECVQFHEEGSQFLLQNSHIIKMWALGETDVNAGRLSWVFAQIPGF